MNMPTKELEKISSLMGHSLMTQRSYKWSGVKDSDSEDSAVKNEVICGCDSDSISICNSCNTITINKDGNVTRISSDNKEMYKEKLLEIVKHINSI